jgi:hypothetical protein
VGEFVTLGREVGSGRIVIGLRVVSFGVTTSFVSTLPASGRVSAEVPSLSGIISVIAGIPVPVAARVVTVRNASIESAIASAVITAPDTVIILFEFSFISKILPYYIG